jgi:SGNH domain (fused to AT3 domains)
MSRSTLSVIAAALALVLAMPPHDVSAMKGDSVNSSSAANDVSKSRSPDAKSATLSQVKKLVAASVKIDKVSSSIAAELPNISADNSNVVYSLPNSCSTPTTDCVFGDTTASRSVVLFGDSHARMWLPAIIPIAITDHLRLIVIGEDGCPAAYLNVPGKLEVCGSLMPQYIATINSIKPVAVILGDRTSLDASIGPVTSAQWQAALTTTINDLNPSGAKIAVLGDIQVFNVILPQCLAANPLAVQKKCSVSNPNKFAPGHQEAEMAATAQAKGSYINTNPWLCTSNRCSPIVGNYIAYWDNHHVSVAYAKHLSGVMGSALSKVL